MRSQRSNVTTSSFADQESGRSAIAYLINEPHASPTVSFFQDGKEIERRNFLDKTFRYAEDAAENFAIGVLILAK